MLSKLSLKCFAYDFIETFCFPTEEIRNIFSQHSKIKCHLYWDLTDIDSRSFFIMLICEIHCSLKESEARQLIFEILSKSETKNSLDTSHGYYKKFSIHNGNLRKQMGLYKVENIDNPNVCTIVVNPKEYFEKFRNKSINKKHKGVIKDTKGMCFEDYPHRIWETDQEPKQKKKWFKKDFR